MNDKEIVWNTLYFLKRDESRSHINMIDKVAGKWKDYDVDDRIRLRGLMANSKLINIKNGWDFEITAEGMLAEKDQFNDKGILKFKYTQEAKSLRQIAIIVSVTTLLTVGLQMLSSIVFPQERIQMEVIPATMKTDSLVYKLKQHLKSEPVKRDTIYVKTIK